jgi:peptidoglycan LD-endopeptidase CwlK
MPVFSKSSREKLETCDGNLQRLFNEVIMYQDCTIVCGRRGKDEQDAAFDAGFSQVKWPNSKHNSLPSKAVDVVPFPIEWYNVPKFKEFGKLVKEVAKRLEIEVEWGGDWQGGFIDYPHWQVK